MSKSAAKPAKIACAGHLPVAGRLAHSCRHAPRNHHRRRSDIGRNRCLAGKRYLSGNDTAEFGGVAVKPKHRIRIAHVDRCAG